MGCRCGDWDNQAVDRFGNHDAIGNLIRSRHMVEHAEVAFEDPIVLRLAFTDWEAVDGEFADSHGVGVPAGRRRIAGLRYVVLRKGITTTEAAMPIEEQSEPAASASRPRG